MSDIALLALLVPTGAFLVFGLLITAAMFAEEAGR